MGCHSGLFWSKVPFRSCDVTSGIVPGIFKFHLELILQYKLLKSKKNQRSNVLVY